MATHALIEKPASVEPTTPAEVSAKKHNPPRTLIFRVLALGIVAGVVAGLSIWVLPGLIKQTAPNVIQASGRIEGREVTLAPKEIQGRVKRLLVDEGFKVQKGQLLAELESQQLDARFATLDANVANVDAQVKQASIDIGFTIKNSDASIAAAEAVVSAVAARLSRSEAVLENNKAEYDRQTTLFREGVISKSALDQATMNYQTSLADADAAQKDLRQATANLALAQASKDTIELKQQQLHALQEVRRGAAAQLREAQANIEEREIRAPIDGTILSRTVEVGDVVNPGSPVFVMVDMSRLYLKVYVPEPDIPKLKLGDLAQITVDAFPGRTFPARITKIYDQAEFTPKNVETKEERVKLVFGVELTFVQADAAIKPGMPADCTVQLETK
jgi:multidrug resistance efflux pump